MKSTLAAILLAASAICAEKARPAEVAFDAVIETIQFENVPAARQKLVLERLGVRVGDALSIDARHQIGRALRTAQSSVAEQPLTFTYTPGTRHGVAKLIITAGC
jgi:outer membrane protein assembly factor BamA